jgi:hypothetical protein
VFLACSLGSLVGEPLLATKGGGGAFGVLAKKDGARLTLSAKGIVGRGLALEALALRSTSPALGSKGIVGRGLVAAWRRLLLLRRLPPVLAQAHVGSFSLHANALVGVPGGVGAL